jgi:hypothetical protein
VYRAAVPPAAASGLARLEAKVLTNEQLLGSNGLDAWKHWDEPVGVRTVRDNLMQ